MPTVTKVEIVEAQFQLKPVDSGVTVLPVKILVISIRLHLFKYQVINTIT